MAISAKKRQGSRGDPSGRHVGERQLLHYDGQERFSKTFAPSPFLPLTLPLREAVSCHWRPDFTNRGPSVYSIGMIFKGNPKKYLTEIQFLVRE
jgi:hypothetical protein